jgi:hypothetical protein
MPLHYRTVCGIPVEASDEHFSANEESGFKEDEVEEWGEAKGDHISTER